MPITIKPATHGACVLRREGQAEDSRDLLRRACRKESAKCVELLQSSFDFNLEAAVRPSANGFVQGAILAYNQHHHLRIRPEDVWFAIISQLSFYINRHAEELREMFVAHEDKKELTIELDMVDRYTVEYSVFAQKMSHLIQKNVLDPELRGWVMPAFSTTTEHDSVVAAILLMGVTQKYFSYGLRTTCGIPSVTLLGQKTDWQLIYSRLDKLETFGAEPSQFCKLLRPVISHFIDSFDDPTSDDVIGFWQRIAHKNYMGSGSAYYSAWITAFCFWNEDGESLYRVPVYGDYVDGTSWEEVQSPLLRLDGVSFHTVDTDKVPSCYSSVPIKVDDNGDTFDATMVAGSVGINCSSSGDELDGGLVELDTVSAETGWWMFESKDPEPKVSNNPRRLPTKFLDSMRPKFKSRILHGGVAGKGE